MIRLGVIGCGVIGRTHARCTAESELFELVAVADRRRELADELAATLDLPRAYGAALDLLSDPELDAVVLALPAGGRAELALKALRGGRHVLLEKPAGLNAGEVRVLLAARGDLVAGCCSSRYRFLPSAEAATEAIAAGGLGGLRLLRRRGIEWAGEPGPAPPSWRASRALNGGGILANLGSYDLDFLLGITGWSLVPRFASASAWAVPEVFGARVAPGSDAEAHVTALIRCEGGVTIALERGEFFPSAGEDVWEVVGSRGALRGELYPTSTKAVFRDEAHADRGVWTGTLWEGDEQDGDGLMNRLLLEDFGRAILEGRQPRTSLEQAAIVQAVTDAIYAAAARSTTVAVELPRVAAAQP